MTVEDDPIDTLRSQILALNGTSDKCKADRVATSQMFVSMAELFDTALIRTPRIVDQLWNNRGATIELVYVEMHVVILQQAQYPAVRAIEQPSARYLSC